MHAAAQPSVKEHNGVARSTATKQEGSAVRHRSGNTIYPRALYHTLPYTWAWVCLLVLEPRGIGSWGDSPSMLRYFPSCLTCTCPGFMSGSRNMLMWIYIWGLGL